jgi:hypothetical protein
MLPTDSWHGFAVALSLGRSRSVAAAHLRSAPQRGGEVVGATRNRRPAGRAPRALVSIHAGTFASRVGPSMGRGDAGARWQG